MGHAAPGSRQLFYLDITYYDKHVNMQVIYVSIWLAYIKHCIMHYLILSFDDVWPPLEFVCRLS